MLKQERHHIILSMLREKRAVSVQELTVMLGAAESTIRRDLVLLAEQGHLNKVHGGATATGNRYLTGEEYVEVKKDLNLSEKQDIARYAASLITAEDFVYIDAGTTTQVLCDAIAQTKAVFVTNGVIHAKKLAAKNCTVYIVGGQLKSKTEAIIGSEATETLMKYNFTKGFFGVNGISVKAGYTAPDAGEAMIKKVALPRCLEVYVLADSSKFHMIAPITYAKLGEAAIITSLRPEEEFFEQTRVIYTKESGRNK